MFDKLFHWAPILRRHREGPLAPEREQYLAQLNARGMAHSTLLRQASYLLCVAHELTGFPSDKWWTAQDVEGLAETWACGRVAQGKAAQVRWPQDQFRLATTGFLGFLGRLAPQPAPRAGRYDALLDQYIEARQRDGRMEATCRGARWQVGKFLGYLEQRGIDLGAVKAEDIDAYFEHSSKRWGRASLRTAGQALRAWFAYANQRGWVAINLAPGILLARLYRQETLPIGPTWEEVSALIKDTARGKPVDLRDRAILLLFSVYGLRSGEVRRLVIEDIDWRKDRIRVVRSKSGREQLLPLEAGTGDAIARYLREGRPRSDSRVRFLRDRAPHEPLSSSGMYNVVTRHAASCSTAPRRGRGPHGLRHACARHLLDSGRSIKEIGDHLGHRSPDATQIYAKVDLAALRRVALQDMGGLA